MFGSQGSGRTIIEAIEEFDRLHPREEIPEQAADSDEEKDDSSPRGRARGHDTTRPNFFVCIRISDPAICIAAQNVQESVVRFEPSLASACLPTSALHITLVTLRINNDDEMARACQVLTQFGPTLQAIIPPTHSIRMHGLNLFRDRVLFGQVVAAHVPVLKSIVTSLKKAFVNAHVPLIGSGAILLKCIEFYSL